MPGARFLLLPRPGAGNGLGDALRRELGLASVDSARLADDFAVPRRMAHEAARRAYAAMNLRRGKLAYAPFARRRERRVAVALSLCLATICLFGASVVRGIAATRGEMREMRLRQAALLSEALGDGSSLEDLEAAVAQVRKQVATMEQSVGVSALRRWRDAMEKVPVGVDAEFERIDIDRNRVWIQAVARDGDTATTLRRSLQEAPGFMENPVYNMSARPDGRYSLELKLRCR